MDTQAPQSIPNGARRPPRRSVFVGAVAGGSLLAAFIGWRVSVPARPPSGAQGLTDDRMRVAASHAPMSIAPSALDAATPQSAATSAVTPPNFTNEAPAASGARVDATASPTAHQAPKAGPVSGSPPSGTSPQSRHRPSLRKRPPRRRNPSPPVWLKSRRSDARRSWPERQTSAASTIHQRRVPVVGSPRCTRDRAAVEFVAWGPSDSRWSSCAWPPSPPRAAPRVRPRTNPRATPGPMPSRTRAAAARPTRLRPMRRVPPGSRTAPPETDRTPRSCRARHPRFPGGTALSRRATSALRPTTPIAMAFPTASTVARTTPTRSRRAPAAAAFPTSTPTEMALPIATTVARSIRTIRTTANAVVWAEWGCSPQAHRAPIRPAPNRVPPAMAPACAAIAASAARVLGVTSS